MLDRDSTVYEWMADARGAALLGPLMAQVMSQTPGSSDGEPSAMGMDAMDLLGHIPLPVLLRFFGRALPAGPDELVDGLLAQVHAVGGGRPGAEGRT